MSWHKTPQEETIAGEAVWLMQNSWGEDWGKNGFATIAVEDGTGFQGLNLYAHFVTLEDIQLY